MQVTKENPSEGEATKETTNIKHVSGSTAGAGSGDFHQYRTARTIEMERLKKLDKDYEEQTKLQEYNVTILLN